ncbi:MAG TPA: MtnX-like HAD-IB family phosphatase [Candidatus Krumholzibacteria bacterium]|nr:MtnX-like HAD-IB family phosphatase [Candidatus Krumholzibacteria bacterium]
MRKIAVLCDFDGTVAQDDVGNLLFRTFAAHGDAAEVVSKWKRGEISSRECLEQEASLARCSDTELHRFVQSRALDPYFKDFHDFARQRGIEVVVLSDGLDYYIEKILIRNGLGEIEFFSNRLRLEAETLKVEFPWYNLLECTDCGCCKTHHLFRYRQNGYFIVYVGDGLSDRCPCESADLVFAKGDLLRHCREKNIAHVEFRNFRDVEREVLKRLVLSNDGRPSAPR